MNRFCRIVLVTGLLPLCRPAHAQILSAIRSADHLDCATLQGVDDWNGMDIHGDLSGLGAEICRAVATAILGTPDLGTPDKLTIHVFPGEPEALAALKDGNVALAVGISPSTTNAVQYGIGFGPPVFYDSQRIMLAKQTEIKTLAGLRDQLICALDLTPPEMTLRDTMTAAGIPYALMTHSEQGEMDAAIAVRRCVAGTGMETRLAQSRANFHARVSDFVFLPERLALEPVVPAYRYGDQVFGLIVDWTVYALVEAESLGITQANVGESAKREDVRAGQLLGSDFATAQSLGLAHNWAAKVIATTGNYGEIFERTVGRPYHLDRDLNRLWSDGGLMRPLPMR